MKVFGRQREVEERFRQKNAELYQASFGAQFISGLIMPAMTFIGNLVYVGIAVVGGLQVASGAMQLGDVQAFIQYSRQFTQPLAQLGSMANLLQSGVASAERVFELLDTDEQSPDPSPSEAPSGGRGRLVFEDVSFSYSPDKPLISSLSLVAEPGQTVAIVGPTGAGKTTLVNLMMRFYELDAGRITLDGVDVTAMTRDGLRSRMGMVLQDTWLFGGTIRDNIAYGRPGASEDEILEAAKATYVDRFVRSLPEGYDTVLDDEGGNVSAGEKQLLTIARAFLARPSVLILDEATSFGGYPHRGAGAEGDECFAVRPDFVCHCPPALHHPRRRPHPGDGSRADRGAGDARFSCWRRAGRMRRCTRRSSRLRWRRFRENNNSSVGLETETD